MKKRLLVGLLLLFVMRASAQNEDCINAEVICSDGPINQTPNGTGAIDDLNGVPASCGTHENEAAWYIFAFRDDMPPNSVIEFTITPLDGVTDYDFAIWGPDVDCDNLGPDIRCNFSPIGTTGLMSPPPNGAFEQPMVVQPGESYYILVDNFSHSSIGFSMTWGGSAAPYLNCEPECTVSLTLPDDLTICHPPYEILIAGDVQNEIGGVTYEWTSLVGDHIIESPFDLTTTISAPSTTSSTGVYLLCAFDDMNGGKICDDCDTISVEFLVGPIIDIEDSGLYCFGDEINVSATPAGGDWSGDINADGYIFTENYGPGLFNAIYSIDINGCIYQDQFDYEILPSPEFEHNLVDTTFCDGETVLNLELINVQDVNTVLWYIPSDVLIISGSTNDAQLEVNWNNSTGNLICVEAGNDCTLGELICMDVAWLSQDIPQLSVNPDVLCVTDDVVQIIADIEPGIFTGNGIIDNNSGLFDPAVAGPGYHDIIYELEGVCPEYDTIRIQVIDTISAPTIICENVGFDFVEFSWQHSIATSFLVSTYIDGILWDDMLLINENSFIINYLLAGQVVTIEIIAIDNGVCSNSSLATQDCNTDPCPNYTLDILDVQAQCTSNPPIVLLASPSGGVFDGSGVVNPLTGEFDPFLAGPGDHWVYYSIDLAAGCVYKDSTLITVIDTRSPDLGTEINPICINNPPIAITTDLSPGIFTGSGIADEVTGVFDPSLSGPGQHWLTFTSSMTCTEADSILIEVLDTIMPPEASCGTLGTDFVQFNWIHSSSTDFLVSTYIDGILHENMLAISGTTHTVNGLLASQFVTIEIIAVSTGLCGNSSVVSLDCSSEPCPMVPIDMPDFSAVCVNSGQVQFSASPTGGEYSGANGIMVDPNTGALMTNVAGVGTHTVYYDLSTPEGCTYRDSAVVTIEDVLPIPNVYCTGVSLDSVSFSWDPVPGVTNYIINTFINGEADEVGLNLTSNTYNRIGLNESDQVSIEVVFVGTNTCGNSAVGLSDPDCITQNCADNPPVIDSVILLCESSFPVILSATPDGGTFGGSGVTNGMFDPTLTGPGVHQISYVYIDDIGCSQYQTANILVEEELAIPIIMCGTTSPNSVEITWSHSNPSVTTYEISYQINGGPVMMDVTSNLSITISPLVQGDSISMEVVAQGVNSCGNSQAGIQSCIAEDCPPNPFDLDENQTQFCVSDETYQITGFPMERIEITCDGHVLDANGLFDPSISGPGLFEIIFIFDDGYNCVYEETLIFEVFQQFMAPDVNCAEQTTSSVSFEWPQQNGVEYMVTYFLDNQLESSWTTMDNQITIDGLEEGVVVSIEVVILNEGPCGNSEAGQANCTALDCDITIAGIPDDLIFCDSSTVLVEPVIGGSGISYTYEWITPEGVESTKDIFASVPGEYVLNVMDERFCMDRASFTLQLDAIESFLSMSDPSCFGNEDGYIRIDEISGGTSPYQISFNGGSYGGVREFTGLTAADYNISIQDVNGCMWTEDFLISEPDEFLFNIDSNVVVQYGDSLVFDVEVDSRTDSLVTYKVWLTSDPNVDCLDCWTLISVPTFATSYILNVETSNGCPGKGIVRSTIKHDRSVYIPNVFRPTSNHAQNQIFQIFTSEEVEQVEALEIYNRWGDRMYSLTAPYDPRSEPIGWDGIYRGSLASDGVYVYWLSVRFTDGTREFFNGDVTLLR